MRRKLITLFILSLFLTPGLKAFLIPVMDVGSCFAEGIIFADELSKITTFVNSYWKFKKSLDERVSKLKKGFAGLKKDKIENMSDLSEDIQKSLKESSYYAQYLKGTLFERVGKKEKLLDIVRETIDFEKGLKERGIYNDPEYKVYLDALIEAYKEHIVRLEDRIKYINICKETGRKRLKVCQVRYDLFRNIAEGKDSKLGDKVGSEAQAISILSESMLDAALQDHEIAVLLRLKLEEGLSRNLNQIYLDNLMMMIQQKKRPR